MYGCGAEGQQKVEKLLNSSDDVFERFARMRKRQFYQLRDWLEVHTELCNSRWVSMEEKILSFLHIVGKGAVQEDVGHIFHRSTQTVSKYV